MSKSMNDWREDTIAELLSHYTAEKEAELESMTDEELECELGTLRHKAEKEWQAEKMEILEERGA